MNVNDFMSWLLRSPFHGLLSGGMMLITVTGRKTGRKYTTPVGYYAQGECLWVITSRDRKWWRNLTDGAGVELLLKRKPVKAFAEIELEEKSVEKRMYEYLRHVPQAVKPLGIRMNGGQLESSDIARTAKDRLFIKLKLAE